MTSTPFDILKQTCHDACHERHACAEGYRQMLASENVSQMMATWRNNWEDIVKSKYADIIRTELPKQYPAIKADMNAAGIYHNECPDNARQFVKVIITDTDNPIHIYGDASAYILGNAKVIAHDHAQVYHYSQASIPTSRDLDDFVRIPVSSQAQVTLLDHSHGSLLTTDTVTVSHFATVNYHNE